MCACRAAIVQTQWSVNFSPHYYIQQLFGSDTQQGERYFQISDNLRMISNVRRDAKVNCVTFWKNKRNILFLCVLHFFVLMLIQWDLWRPKRQETSMATFVWFSYHYQHIPRQRQSYGLEKEGSDNKIKDKLAKCDLCLGVCLGVNSDRWGSRQNSVDFGHLSMSVFGRMVKVVMLLSTNDNTTGPINQLRGHQGLMDDRPWWWPNSLTSSWPVIY